MQTRDLADPSTIYEQQHDKTNTVTVRPAKTQISLGFRPVWSLCCPHEETLGLELPIERKAKTLIRLGGSPGWSESPLGAQPSCWLCHEVAHIVFCFLHTILVKFSVQVWFTVFRLFTPYRLWWTLAASEQSCFGWFHISRQCYEIRMWFWVCAYIWQWRH